MRKAFTLLELLIALSIIAVLAAILTPAYFLARAKARQSACLSNIQQMGIALGVYATENDGYYPDMHAWQHWEISRHDLLRCPAAVMSRPGQDTDAGIPGYALNSHLLASYSGAKSQDAPPYPSVTVQLCEQAVGQFVAVTADLCQEGNNCTGVTGERGFERHNGGANYEFLDGHAKWYLPTAFPPAVNRPGDTNQPRFAW